MTDMHDSAAKAKGEGWNEPAPAELEAAEQCRNALETVAREAALMASSSRRAVPPPSETADLSELLATIKGFELDPASLTPENLNAYRRFVEHASTALEFSDRVHLGHRDGLDVRDEMYGLVVSSLRDIARQSTEYREALGRALSTPQASDASLPLDLVKSEGAPRPAAEEADRRPRSRLAMLTEMVIAFGSIAVDLLMEGIRRAGALASAALSPFASLVSAAASLAGLRPPEAREVWRGGEHIRSALFGRQKERSEGKIIGDDPAFFACLAVTDAYVLTGRDGKMTRLDRYLDSKGGAVAVDAFYPRRPIEPIVEGEQRPSAETECQFDIAPGSRCLPLSPFYRVTSLSFYDRRGRPIGGDREIREGLLGGVVIDAPSDARRVSYRVAPKADSGIDTRLYETLREALPRLETSVTPPQKVFVELLRALDIDDRKKSRLWLATAAAAGFVYTKDDFVQSYLRNAGENLNEVISGLRMGTCDSFAFHAAVMLSSIGLPAVSIVGATARRMKQDFLMNPGHAQAAVPFPDGIEIFDLTTLTRDRRTRGLGWLERRAELKALASAGAASATGGAAIVREKLFGAYRDPRLSQRVFGYDPARCGDDKAPPHLVPSFENSDLDPAPVDSPRDKASLEARVLCALGDYMGLAGLRSNLSFDRRDERVLSPEEAKIARGLDAMVNRLELERAVDASRSEGSLEPLFKFMKDNSACAALDDDARAALPPEYGKLAGYDPQSLALAFVTNVLKSSESTDKMRREAAAWLVQELRPSENMDLGIFEPSLRYEFRLPSARLRASKGAGLVDQALLDAMTDEEVLGLGMALSQNVAVWIMDVSRVEGERLDDLDMSGAVAHASRSSFAQIGRALESVAGEALRRGSKPREDAAELLVAWGALLVRFGTELGDPGPYRRSFAAFLTASGGPAALLPVLERGQKFLIDALVGAVKESSFDWMDVNGPSPRAASELEAAMRERLSRTIHPDREYGRAFDALASLGFFPDLSPSVAEIEASAALAIRAAARLGKGPMIAIPGRDTPASELVFAYCSENGGPLLRSLFAISSHAGLESGWIEKAWPGRSDAVVAAHLLSCLKMRSTSLSYRLGHLTYEAEGPAELSVPAQHLATISAIFADSNPAGRAVMDHLEARHAFEHPLDSLLERIAIRHPVHWGKFVASFGPGTDWISKRRAEEHVEAVTAGLIGRLLEDASPDERYTALRWVAAEQLSGPHEEGKEPSLLSSWRTAVAPRRDVLTSEAAASACLATFTSSVVAEDPELSTLSWRARAAALDAYALTLMCESRDRYALWRTAGIPQGIAAVLGDRSPITDAARSPSAEIWARIHRQHFGALDLSSVLQSAETIADRIGRAPRPRSTVFSYYLYERTGLLAPISPAGDFESLRNYVHGDDLRTVDWKASARLDRVVTRQRREPEARPIALVVDADWLSRGYASFAKDRKDYPELRELFVQVILAERQGVDLDLYIAPRGDLVRLPGVLRRRGGAGTFRTEAFRSEVSRWIRACGEVGRLEREIFGAGLEPPRVAIKGEDLELRRGTIVSAAVAEKNRSLTSRPLESLGKRGMVVHLLRSAHV